MTGGQRQDENVGIEEFHGLANEQSILILADLQSRWQLSQRAADAFLVPSERSDGKPFFGESDSCAAVTPGLRLYVVSLDRHRSQNNQFRRTPEGESTTSFRVPSLVKPCMRISRAQLSDDRQTNADGVRSVFCWFLV